MKTRILFAITLAGAVLCVLPNVAVPQQGGNSQGDQSAAIEGTWIQQILPAGAPAPFTALVWFSAGGTTGATGSNDRLAGISPLIGSWRPSDNNTYVSSLDFFSFDPNSGAAVYTIQNHITYWLTGYNSIMGKGTAVKCDVSFTPSSCSPFGTITITGTRLIPQGASN